MHVKSDLLLLLVASAKNLILTCYVNPILCNYSWCVVSSDLCDLQVGSIENEYRIFEMEVVAGDDDLETEVKQHKARFQLNFAQVKRIFVDWHYGTILQLARSAPVLIPEVLLRT